MYFINQRGEYYEGDKADYRDLDVPKRPDYIYKWTGTEWIIDPDIINAQSATELTATDAGMIRGIDDLIAVLIAKSVIKEADLPAALRDKVTARAAIREKLK